MPPHDERWLTNSEIVRLTGLSDEKVRQLCEARVFASARRREDKRWEAPEHEVRSAQLLDPNVVVARSVAHSADGARNERQLSAFFAQLVRLKKLQLSTDGKMSIDQEAYFNEVKGQVDPAAVPVFRHPDAGTGEVTPSPSIDARELTSEPGRAIDESVSRVPSAEPDLRVPVERADQDERPLWEEFVEYMMGHGDPRRLPDEIFAGRYAPEFIPPLGAMYFVCLNVAPPADPETIEPRTIVRCYPYWRLSRNGKYLERLPQVDTLSVPGALTRGSVPSEFATSSERYLQLRESWRMRAVEARAKLRLRVAVGGASFLESFSEPPRIETELARYREERLHPSELPESVMANLVDTPFLPVIGMARVECTGQHAYCDKHNGMLIDSDDPEPGCDVYTWCRRTAGWDDSVNGVVAHEAEERAFTVKGAYANGYEPIDCRLGNAEYDAYRAAWEQAQERHSAKS